MSSLEEILHELRILRTQEIDQGRDPDQPMFDWINAIRAEMYLVDKTAFRPPKDTNYQETLTAALLHLASRTIATIQWLQEHQE